MAVEVDEASNGVVGGGGVEGGACRKFLQPDGTKSNSTRFRVSCWRGGEGGYSFILGRFMVSADVSQPIQIVFCIGWLTSADTNIAQPINKPPAHTTVPTEHHSGGGDCSDREHHNSLFH
jgi:hypothetical protein